MEDIIKNFNDDTSKYRHSVNGITFFLYPLDDGQCVNALVDTFKDKKVEIFNFDTNNLNHSIWATKQGYYQ